MTSTFRYIALMAGHLAAAVTGWIDHWLDRIGEALDPGSCAPALEEVGPIDDDGSWCLGTPGGDIPEHRVFISQPSRKETLVAERAAAQLDGTGPIRGLLQNDYASLRNAAAGSLGPTDPRGLQVLRQPRHRRP